MSAHEHHLPSLPRPLSQGLLQLASMDPGHGHSQLHGSQGHILGIAESFAVHPGKGHPCAGKQLLGALPEWGRRNSLERQKGSPASPARAELPSSSPSGSSPGTAKEVQLHPALSRGQTRPHC